jgi:hypothetical protein
MTDDKSEFDRQALHKLVPGFRLDWSGLRNRFEEFALRFEKLATYEMRAAHLDEIARQFEDAVVSALAASPTPAPAPVEPVAMEVLPLEWQLFDDVFGGGWQATTLGEPVTIRRSVSAAEPFEIAGVRFLSIEAAQASAQAVHDQRVREIIKAPPTPNGIEEAAMPPTSLVDDLGLVEDRISALSDEVEEARTNYQMAHHRAADALRESAAFKASAEAAEAKVKVLTDIIKAIVGTTHRPNPTDPSRIDIAPGQHRAFQSLIEGAKVLTQPAAARALETNND